MLFSVAENGDNHLARSHIVSGKSNVEIGCADLVIMIQDHVQLGFGDANGKPSTHGFFAPHSILL
jgi:hypothetical protein